MHVMNHTLQSECKVKCWCKVSTFSSMLTEYKATAWMAIKQCNFAPDNRYCLWLYRVQLPRRRAQNGGLAPKTLSLVAVVFNKNNIINVTWTHKNTSGNDNYHNMSHFLSICPFTDLDKAGEAEKWRCVIQCVRGNGEGAAPFTCPQRNSCKQLSSPSRSVHIVQHKRPNYLYKIQK